MRLSSTMFMLSDEAWSNLAMLCKFQIFIPSLELKCFYGSRHIISIKYVDCQNKQIVISSLYICMVKTIYLFSCVETPHKFTIVKLQIRKLGSSSALGESRDYKERHVYRKKRKVFVSGHVLLRTAAMFLASALNRGSYSPPLPPRKY